MANCSVIDEQRNTTDIWLKGILTSEQANNYQFLNKSITDDSESLFENIFHSNDELENGELPNAMEFVSVECDMLFESDFDITDDRSFNNGSLSEKKCRNKKRNGHSSQKNSVFPLLYPVPAISELFRYRSVDVYQRTNKDGPYVKIFNSESIDDKSSDVCVNGIKPDDFTSGTAIKDKDCDVCGRLFSAQDFETHVQQDHMEGTLYKCEVCQSKFKDKKELILHRILHVNVMGKPYPCSVCKERFTNKTALKNHYQDHSSVKDVRSELCVQKFEAKSEDAACRKSCSAEKGYKCQYCHKTFMYKVQCSSHEKLHTSDSLTKCSECDGTFTIRQMVIHQKKHIKGKLYQCEKCGATFRARSSLWSHKKSHLGRKSRECPDCGSMFRKSSALKKHRKAHHD